MTLCAEVCNELNHDLIKRKIKVSVISDIHLGSIGCHAKELADYLKSIDPEILILNGDIIDVWAFNKRFWPTSHTKVVQQIFKLMSAGTTIYYLTGNHDEIFRKYSDDRIGNLHLLDKLVLRIDDKKYWFFHGDVFDITLTKSKWLAKLGSTGYNILILINRIVNSLLTSFGFERVSFSNRVKKSVKSAVQFISKFEKTVISLAFEQGYDFVVCGHIHQPVIREVDIPGRKITYMNSGDWIENLTALEYSEGSWKLYTHSLKEVDGTRNDLAEELNLPERMVQSPVLIRP